MVYTTSSPFVYFFDPVDSPETVNSHSPSPWPLKQKKESNTNSSTDKKVRVSPRSEYYRYSSDEGVEAKTSPAVDVYDTPENYIIVASLPGVSTSDVNIEFDPEEHILKLSGELAGAKSLEQNEELKQYLKVNERTLGKFERQVYVPSDPEVNDENIQAKMNNGVLKVTLPKVHKPVAEKRKINVTTEESG